MRRGDLCSSCVGLKGDSRGRPGGGGGVKVTAKARSRAVGLWTLWATHYLAGLPSFGNVNLGFLGRGRLFWANSRRSKEQ